MNKAPASGGNVTSFVPRINGIASTTGSTMNGEHDPESTSVLRRKMPGSTIQHTPATAVMQSFNSPSLTQNVAKKSSPAGSTKNPFDGHDHNTKPASSGPTITASNPAQSKLSAAKQSYGTSNALSTSHRTRKSAERDDGLDEAVLKQWSLICKDGRKYYELGCQLAECRQNARGRNFFKGMTGLKIHMKTQHGITVPDVKKCRIHEFSHDDCNRIRGGKDPKDKVPQHITALILQMPKEGDAERLEDSESEEIPLAEQHAERLAAAASTTLLESEGPSPTLVKLSNPKEFSSSVVSTKQRPETSPRATYHIKPVDFKDAEQVASLLRGDVARSSGVATNDNGGVQYHEPTHPSTPQAQQTGDQQVSATAAGKLRETDVSDKVTPTSTPAAVPPTGNNAVIQWRSPPTEPRRRDQQTPIANLQKRQSPNVTSGQSPIASANTMLNRVNPIVASTRIPTGPRQQQTPTGRLQQGPLSGLTQPSPIQRPATAKAKRPAVDIFMPRTGTKSGIQVRTRGQAQVPVREYDHYSPPPKKPGANAVRLEESRRRGEDDESSHIEETNRGGRTNPDGRYQLQERELRAHKK